MRRAAALLLVPIAVLASVPARADGAPAEVRLGVLWPDAGPPVGRQPGADLNAEVLSPALFGPWTALPAWLRWAASPRINLGGSLNTAGATQQAYAGLTWTVPLATGLLHREDGLSIGFSVGPELLGGPGVPRGLDGGPQLRLGAEIGYQVTPRLGLYVLFDHVSGGAMAHEGDSLNDVGVRVGLHF